MITTKSLGRNGELGNQFFQISAVIGTAVRHNVKFNFPKWDCMYSQCNYSKYFRNPIPDSLDVKEKFDIYKEPVFSYVEIPYEPCQNLDLQGYFQSEKYFSHCESEIRRYFQPSADVESKILKLDYKNVIGLQLRFYDGTRPYGLTTPGNDPNYGVHFYTVEENLPFIERAINFFGKDKTFFVSTNNYPKARQLFGSYSNFYFLENYSHIESLFVLSRCEHNIISNSTFGWWSAWLNSNSNKVVFAPKEWIKSYRPMKDVFPDGWRVE